MPLDRERYESEKDWPPHVWCIGLDRLDLLGVDDEGDLYWDGKRVEVRKRLNLTMWQRVGAVVIAGSTLVAAAAAVASAIADWKALDSKPAGIQRSAPVPPPALDQRGTGTARRTIRHGRRAPSGT